MITSQYNKLTSRVIGVGEKTADAWLLNIKKSTNFTIRNEIDFEYLAAPKVAEPSIKSYIALQTLRNKELKDVDAEIRG